MDIAQQIVNAIWLGSVYSLFALGYALVFSVLGLLNLAHSAVFMWGAYIGLFFVLQVNLPILLAIPLAIVGAGIISVGLDWVAFRPLRNRNAPRIAQLISSIGVATILVRLAQILFTAQPQNFPLELLPNQPVAGIAGVRLLDSDIRITVIQVIIIIASIVLMWLLRMLVQRTRQGQAMRTVAFNERVAALLGVPVNRIFRLTFFLAGASAGAAGMLYGLAYNSITPFMGDSIALKGLTVIVLGGMSSIEGAVLGGFVVAGIEVFSVAFLSSTYRDAIIFLLLFVILVVRPQGLLGQSAVERA